MEKIQKLSFTKLREELVALSTDELKSTLGGCLAHGEEGYCPINYQYLDIAANELHAMGYMNYNFSGFDLGFFLCGTFDGGFSETGWSFTEAPYDLLDQRIDMLFTGGDATIIWDPTDPTQPVRQILNVTGSDFNPGWSEVYDFTTDTTSWMSDEELEGYNSTNYNY